MSSASLRQGTIVLMELRCSPHLPALLLPSSSPPSPWHNCCIAADAISCFLSGISAVGPHLTLSSLLSDSPLLFAVESLSPIALHSHSLPCISFKQISSYTFPLYFTQTCSSLFCHVPLILLSHLSLCVCCANCAVVLFPLLSL